MKLHEAWLHKAENDLLSAQKLISGADPLPDTSIYHTQQCAEKSLKAFPAYHQKPLEKTHDIQMLLELCLEIDSTFDSIYESGISLNPYSVAFRYPGIILQPDIHEVEKAIDDSSRILEFVKNKII